MLLLTESRSTLLTQTWNSLVTAAFLFHTAHKGFTPVQMRQVRLEQPLNEDVRVLKDRLQIQNEGVNKVRVFVLGMSPATRCTWSFISSI